MASGKSGDWGQSKKMMLDFAISKFGVLVKPKAFCAVSHFFFVF